MFVSKIFLANSFDWQNNCLIVFLLCRHDKYQEQWPMQHHETV